MNLIILKNFFEQHYKTIILSYLIFIFPVLSLYANNYLTISIFEFNYIVVACSIFFFIALIISSFFRDKFDKIFLTITCFWWLQISGTTHTVYFQLKKTFYYWLYDFVDGKYELFTDFFAIYFFFCFFGLVVLFYKFYNKYLFNFVCYILLINFIFLIYPISEKQKPKEFQDIKLSSLNVEPSSKINANITNKISNNIYFLLMDEMPSAEFAKKNFNLKYDNFLKDINSDNFNHYDNSQSFSNRTVNSLSHIFLLSEKRGYKIFKKSFNLRNKVPYNKTISPDQIPVLNALRINQYKSYWFANGLLDCSERFIQFFSQCISRKNNYAGSFRVVLLNHYLKQNLILKKMITSYDNLKLSIVTNNQTELLVFKVFFKNNINLIKEKKNFFFIHNLSPHAPIRTAKCEILYNGHYYEINEMATWKSSIECALNQLVETINLIKKHDPGAIVIAQGDHGTPYGSQKKIRSMHIFNFVDFGNNKDCKNKYTNIKSNVNAVKAAFQCLDMIN